MSRTVEYLESVWRRGLRVPDSREIWEYIAEEGELPTGVFAVPGKFDIGSAPQLKGPLRALRAPQTRDVTSMAGVQCLKTLAGEFWLLWGIENDPGPTQWLQNTNEEGADHAKERFIPLIEQFPSVHEFYRPSRNDKTNTFIRFKHMYMRIEGVNTARNLQRKSIKNQMRSEVWQRKYWKAGKLKEASSRQTQFVHNSKSYTESQPGWIERDDNGEVIGDDLFLWFWSGTRQTWHFHCLGCGKAQPYYWRFERADGSMAGMRWETNERTRRENGEWRWGELAPTVRYECIFCGFGHTDDVDTRRRLTENSHYVALNPWGVISDQCSVISQEKSIDRDGDYEFAPHESFTWNQLGMPRLSWFETKIGGVKNFLLAQEQADKGYWLPLEEFFQKVVAEASDTTKRRMHPRLPTLEVSSVTANEKQHLVYRGVVFPHVLLEVDVQEDHFWFTALAFATSGQLVFLDAGKLFAWSGVEEKQRQWKVLDQNVGVDSKHRQNEVYYECAIHGHWEVIEGRRQWMCWKAFRGSDERVFTYTIRKGREKGRRVSLPYSWPPAMGDACIGLAADDDRRKGLAGKGRYCPVITWSNPTIKDIAKNLRDAIPKQERVFVMAGDWNDELSKQLHSERKFGLKDKYGHTVWKWVVVGKKPNHMWDCFCQGVTRAVMLRLLGQVSSDDTSVSADEDEGEG